VNPTVSKPNGSSTRDASSASATSEYQLRTNVELIIDFIIATESTANPGPQAGGTGTASRNTTDAEEEDRYSGDDEDVSQAVIDELEAFIDYSVGHLSRGQLRKLIDALPKTQETALETQAQPTSVGFQFFIHVSI
jgi:hypothetical protein